MVKVKAKKAVEISQSENHTAAGGNPGGCLFLGGGLWSARRNLSTRSRCKSQLCGLKRKIVAQTKGKVLVVWFATRKSPLEPKGKSLLYGLKREIVVWIKRKVLVVWSEARKLPPRPKPLSISDRSSQKTTVCRK